MSWLWKIMANCFADQIKHHKRQIRSRSREESLDLIFENAPASTRKLLAARGPSPSEAALRREQAALLADAVARLPPDYREVYLLRTLHHLPFDVIALRMRRKVGAVRMLWVRAIESLSSMLEGRTCL